MHTSFTTLFVFALAASTSLAAPTNTKTGGKGGNAVSGNSGNANGGSVTNQGWVHQHVLDAWWAG